MLKYKKIKCVDEINPDSSYFREPSAGVRRYEIFSDVSFRSRAAESEVSGYGMSRYHGRELVRAW